MRAVLFLLTVICGMHALSASDTISMVSALLENAGCGAVQIAKSTRCVQETFESLTSHDTCENFSMYMPCWPKCFCEKGFERMLGAYKPECPQLPPCGGRVKRKSYARTQQ